MLRLLFLSIFITNGTANKQNISCGHIFFSQDYDTYTIVITSVLYISYVHVIGSVSITLL